MKVIEERKPFENWSLKATCTGGSWNQSGKIPCGSMLEMEANDLVKREWSKYPNDSGIDYGFICPICGCFTDIDEKNLTKYLKNMAKDYSKVTNKLVDGTIVGYINKEKFIKWINNLPDDIQIFKTDKDSNDCVDIKVFVEHKSEKFLQAYFEP